MVVINAIINSVYSQTIIRFSLKSINIKPYIKPFITLGVYQFLTSMYISFNVAYLGFVCGETEVGLYTTATKLFTIILSFYTAFTGVMLPRMSSIIARGQINEFKGLVYKSLDLLFSIAFPLLIISEVYASDIIHIIAGNEYSSSVLPMRIIMPLLFIIGYEQVMIIQILTPLKKDKAILINSCLGAILSVIFNLLLVKNYGAIGSSFVWIICEIAVLCSAQFFVNKYIDFKFPWKSVLIRLFISIAIIAFASFIKHSLKGLVLPLVVGASISAILYFIAEVYILKNTTIVTILLQIVSKCKRLYH